MSCQNFDKAVHYAKAAFKDALETEELKDETLSLLFHYYQGLKTIRDEMPKHEHQESEPMFLSDATEDYSYNLNDEWLDKDRYAGADQGVNNISFTPDVNMQDYIQFSSDVDYGETLE